MKKYKVIITIFFIMLLFFSIITYMQSQSYYGKSEDMKWEAYYRREFQDPKNTWSGYLYTDKNNDINEVTTAFYVNDIFYAGDESLQRYNSPIAYIPTLFESVAFNGKDKKVFGFAVFGFKENIKGELKLIIKWQEDGETKMETLILK